MGIFRGTGGTGDSTTDTTVTTVTEKAAEAASSATSAANSATSAANSASSASTSETNAATSETNAATSATASATSATASETAKTAAQAAQTAAETAETNAETAEANAVTAKNQAESARDNAQTAQTAAETAETNAETAYSNTLAIFGDAQDVQDAVNSASASATTATTKASEAATSATNAANSATSAGTSETNAASSASQAATSANTAGSHATDAETAKDAAETAQAAAEAAEANINGLYLGSLADDPTLDGNGVAVTTGDLYFNTTENEVRVYTDNDEWIAVIEAGGDATFNSLTSNNDVVVKGNLEVQGTTITVDSATAQTIDLGDNDKIRFGDGDDLQIYHDGTDSYIANTTGTLKLSGNTDVTGNITVSGTVDGRDIATDGTTLDAVASTYVDVSGDTLTGDLAFGDNVKAKFGAGNDLQIYHNGSASFIDEGGTGDLNIRANNLGLRNISGAYYVYCVSGGSVSLRHNNVNKLATTSSGVDVTGTVVADKFEVTSTSFLESTNLQLSAGFPRLILLENDTTNLNSRISHQNGALRIETLNDAGTTGTKRLDIDHSTGDISFYEDTGTTAKLTWDASAEELQFKDNVDAEFGDGGDLRIFHNGTNSFLVNGNGQLTIRNNAADKDVTIETDDGSGGITDYFRADGSTGEVILYHYGSEKLATKSTGIDVTGTVVADTAELQGAGSFHLQFDSFADSNLNSDLYTIGLNYGNNPSNGKIHFHRGSAATDGDLYFSTAGDTKRLYIENTGDISFYDDAGTSQDFYWDASTSRLGINITSPDGQLDVRGSSLVDVKFKSTGADSTSRILLENDAQAFGLRINGDDKFRIKDETADAVRLTIDTSGNVGIGTTSPSARLHIDSAASTELLRIDHNYNGNQPALILNNQSSNALAGSRISFRTADTEECAIAWAKGSGGSSYLAFHANESERMRIDSNGRLGIGTTSPDKALVVSGVGAEIVINDTDTTDTPLLRFRESGSTSGTIFTNSSNLIFTSGTTEAMRIDSSGNLLVGTTSAFLGSSGSGGAEGANIKSTGVIQNAVSGTTTVHNRLNSDGEVVRISKDGTTVGSIGVSGDDLIIGTTDTGFRFLDGPESIIPWDVSGNTSKDAALDLGASTNRFDNLYLSGGVYLGGTNAEDLLDDYEEGTFTPTFGGSTTNPSGVTYDGQIGQYTKVGRIVHIAIKLGTDAITSVGSGNLRIRGLPFNAAYGLGVGTPVAYSFSGTLTNYEMLLGTDYFDFYRSGYASTSFLATGTNANRLWVYFSYQTS